MTKRRLMIMLLASLLLSTGAKQEVDPHAGPRPLVVMTESTMAYGSHPRLVLYEDGQLIFVKQDRSADRLTGEKHLLYHHVKLDGQQVQEFVQRVADAMADVKPRYYLVRGVTDLPEIELYLRQGDRQTVTWIYALREPGSDERYRRSIEERRPSTRPGPTSRRWVDRIDVLPDELRDLHKWMWELNYDNSVEWTAGRPPGEHIWRTAHANRNRTSPSEQLLYAEDGLLRRHGEDDPAHGLIVDRYPNGQLEREMTLEDGKIVGEFRAYHVNGQLQVSKQFRDGKEHGPYTEYDRRGNRVKVGQNANGLAQGAWLEFDARGTTRREYEMRDGHLHGHERIYNGGGQLIKENWYEHGELVRRQVHRPD